VDIGQFRIPGGVDTMVMQTADGITEMTHRSIPVMCEECLQCFDAVSWAAGRAPSL